MANIVLSIELDWLKNRKSIKPSTLLTNSKSLLNLNRINNLINHLICRNKRKSIDLLKVELEYLIFIGMELNIIIVPLLLMYMGHLWNTCKNIVMESLLLRLLFLFWINWLIGFNGFIQKISSIMISILKTF